MADSPLDLTGQWHGTYAYPGGIGPATPFIADIVENGGSFTGGIIEPDTVHGTGDTLAAQLAGHRGGHAVDFTKTYNGQRTGYENPVDYVGRLSADGMSIEGVWSLGAMNGTFEMQRELEIKEPKELEAEVEAPAPVLAVPHHDGQIFQGEMAIDGKMVRAADGLAYAGIATFPNLPSTVLPVGGTDGLPCGMQVIGPRWSDLGCISAARGIAEILGHG